MGQFGNESRDTYDGTSKQALSASACISPQKRSALGATGIGAFNDEEVHRYLNLRPEQGQVVYHFAIGSPIPDPRLEA